MKLGLAERAVGEFLDQASLSFEKTIDAVMRGRNCHLSHSDEFASDRTAVVGEDRPNPVMPPQARTNRKLNTPVFHVALVPRRVAPRRN